MALVIRNAQIEAMARGMLDRFARSTIAHVQRNFPALAASLPPGEIENGVHHALARAAHHRLETERDLIRFVNVVFVFGRDFDSDPALPWAAEILAGEEPASIRTARLITAALRHQADARGFQARDASVR